MGNNNVGGSNGWSTKNKLKPMKYKDFEWEFNPASCTYSCTKTVIKHKYPELSAVDLEDLDLDGAVITGDGEFIGEDAYARWQELVRVFHEHGPGDFYHPVYTDVNKAILQKLDSKLEARENCISYTFEFWQYAEPVIRLTKLPDPVKPAVVKPNAPLPVPSRTYTVKKGDCLWNIARSYYSDGSKYTVIARANNIKNPNLIYPGQVFVIPYL